MPSLPLREVRNSLHFGSRIESRLLDANDPLPWNTVALQDADVILVSRYQLNSIFPGLFKDGRRRFAGEQDERGETGLVQLHRFVSAARLTTC